MKIKMGIIDVMIGGRKNRCLGIYLDYSRLRIIE